MDASPWVPVEGADDLPPDRLERVVRLGRVSTPDLGPDERRSPQAYLVAQGSATEPLPVHFHTVDQFQYFAHGRGEVGAHRVGHGTAHYSDALTPYGPLRPGPPGMSYLTLRAVHDGGVHYMPDARDDLQDLLGRSARPPSARRNVAVDLGEPIEPDQPGLWRHLHDDPDGLRVSAIDLLAGRAAPPMQVGGGGAYALVVRGGLVAAGDSVATDALRWLPAGAVLEVEAGPDGARVGLLQYPVPVASIDA